MTALLPENVTFSKGTSLFRDPLHPSVCTSRDVTMVTVSKVCVEVVSLSRPLVLMDDAAIFLLHSAVHRRQSLLTAACLKALAGVPLGTTLLNMRGSQQNVLP